MFWDKKDNRVELPDLPPVSTPSNSKLPPIKPSFVTSEIDEHEDHDDFQRHSLPSFPDSPMKQGFSQAAIKEAINSKSIEETSNPENKNIKTMEIEDWSPAPKSIPDLNYQSKSQEPIQKIKNIVETKRPEIFVKIEKFNTAKKTLNEVHSKLNEIDELLKKIRETKLREEQELSSWERDIGNLKTRVQEINENIFEKIE